MRDDLVQKPELRELRRRAYEELNLAIDQSGDELPADWLSKGDRDLASLRDLNEPEWRTLVLRETGRHDPKDPQFPRAAWGDPHRRRNEWFGVALTLGLLAVAVFLALLPEMALLVLAAIVVVAGGALVWAFARRREVILAVALLVAAVIVLIVFVPAGVLAVLALVLAGGGAVAMARRAGALADSADEKAIAVWEQRRGLRARAKEPDSKEAESNEGDVIE